MLGRLMIRRRNRLESPGRSTHADPGFHPGPFFLPRLSRRPLPQSIRLPPKTGVNKPRNGGNHMFCEEGRRASIPIRPRLIRPRPVVLPHSVRPHRPAGPAAHSATQSGSVVRSMSVRPGRTAQLARPYTRPLSPARSCAPRPSGRTPASRERRMRNNGLARADPMLQIRRLAALFLAKRQNCSNGFAPGKRALQIRRLRVGHGGCSPQMQQRFPADQTVAADLTSETHGGR